MWTRTLNWIQGFSEDRCDVVSRTGVGDQASSRVSDVLQFVNDVAQSRTNQPV